MFWSPQRCIEACLSNCFWCFPLKCPFVIHFFTYKSDSVIPQGLIWKAEVFQSWFLYAAVPEVSIHLWKERPSSSSGKVFRQKTEDWGKEIFQNPCLLYLQRRISKWEERLPQDFLIFLWKYLSHPLFCLRSSHFAERGQTHPFCPLILNW